MLETLGLFHPALVHLPIGFILLTIFYEWIQNKKSLPLWLACTGSSLAAIATGLILLKSGYYEGTEVFQHMISGYIIAVLSILILISRWKRKNLFKSQNTILDIFIILALIYGGHKGAEITHGKNYLPFLAKERPPNPNFSTADTIDTYKSIIQPIFESKCIRCHEIDDARGRLNMETMEGLTSDIYGDPAIFPGEITKSEIYKRISLPESNRKHMPPSGEALTFAEKQLISWWISDGADFDENIKTTNPPGYIKKILSSNYNIDFRKKDFYETKIVNPIDSALLNNLKESGFNVSPIVEGNNLLEVSIIGKSKSFTQSKINLLTEAAEQITWLDVSSSEFSDSNATILSRLHNLTIAKLQNTKISNATLSQLKELEHLQSLNIYGCNIDDGAIEDISKMNSLKKIFLWKTGITSEGIDILRKDNSELQVIVGVN